MLRSLETDLSMAAYNMRRILSGGGGGGANIVCKKTSKRTKLHFFKNLPREHSYEPLSRCAADIIIFI